MSYLAQAAGTAHDITVEMRVASGAYQVTFSSAPGATYPLLNITSVGAELNPLTTRRTLAGVEVEVANTPDVQALMAPGYLVQGFLWAEAGPSDPTLKVQVGDAARFVAALGAFPFDLNVGAETVTVTGAVPGADFDTLNVTRGSGAGHFRTDAVGHAAGTPCGRSPQAWPGRIVSEVIIYPNGDEYLVALYACDGLPSYRDGVWALPMQDGLGFYNRTIGRGMGEARVVSDANSPPNSYLVIDGARFASADTINPATFHLTPAGFVYGEDLIESRQRTGNATGQALLNGVFRWPWNGQRGPIFNGEQKPQVGDTLEPLIILENSAANVVLGLLLSIKGDGANGAYDFIYGNDEAQTGVGIPSHRVNTAAISRALGGAPRMRVIIEPGQLLLDVLERELSYLSLFVDIDEGGLITVREIAYPVTTQDCDHQLTDASLVASAGEELKISGRLVNRVTLKADFDPVDKEHRLEINLPGILTNENQLGEEVVFDPTWLPRPVGEDLGLIVETLGTIVSRWGVPRPEFSTRHDWTKHLVKVGDTAAIINPRLPDSLGGQGVALGCLVTGVDSDLNAGIVNIRAEAVGSSRGGYFCPAGEVVNVAVVGGGVYDLTLQTAAASRFASGLLESNTEAAEAEYFATGWAVMGATYATGATTWTGEVQSITGAVLRVSATLAPLVGEIVTPGVYGTFGSAPATMPPLDPIPGNRRPGLQPDATGVAYLWLADAAHTLGAASDQAKDWI
jgi:hypothetical protein